MANDFSADANFKALWRFENGALTADSKGTNTLTASASAPTFYNASYMEGAGCVDFAAANTQCYYITDANLNNGFPFKSGVNGSNKGGYAGWMRIKTLPGLNIRLAAIGKWDTANAKRCFRLAVKDTAGVATLEIGIGTGTGATGDLINHDYQLSINVWYHFTVQYDGDTNTWYMRLLDATGTQLGSDMSGTPASGSMSYNDAITFFAAYGALGAPGSPLDFRADEFVAFNKILSLAESQQIARGTYGAVGGTPVPVFMNQYRQRWA